MGRMIGERKRTANNEKRTWVHARRLRLRASPPSNASRSLRQSPDRYHAALKPFFPAMKRCDAKMEQLGQGKSLGVGIVSFPGRS